MRMMRLKHDRLKLPQNFASALFPLQPYVPFAPCCNPSLEVQLNVAAVSLPGGVQNGTDFRGHRLLPGSPGQPLLMPR